ncbi:Major facilitator superfamily domain general substrate transporter [Penicillium bovifimosum]|uniref:Major facilitator superfamily domain general substrate transporter n=1 Tax=Penicillium bovifimosum TaxID=126998 RepID=A0A9W9H5T9_9EURO|nr:Major facilitator superfamily domain general substrate transporter [Penicillium bovifimosum]KAJ5138499.1 Major facilitator superfamily domain general substrate transporter [Penicillium bovifimosum]
MPEQETYGIRTSSLGSDRQSTDGVETKSEIDYHDGASSKHTDEEHDDPEDIPPRLERQSTELGAPIKVARLKRRGLFGQLALVAEVENPKTYPRKTKWFITFIVALAGATAPMGSSIFFPALSQVSKELNTTSTTTNLSIALYMLAMSIFPLWWSSFSERFGRRTIYLASFSLFVLFNCLSAISSSISMLIVMRMLSGGASASVQAVGAGTIADLWESRERGRAMGIFYLGPLCGPLFAPIVGGVLAQRWGWRSTLWFLSAFGALTLIFILFALPETLTAPKPIMADFEDGEDTNISRSLSRVSSRQVARATTRWIKTLKMFFIDPLKIILYLRFLPVLLTVYYASIAFGSLYVLNISVEETFGKAPYNFSTIIVGLLYIPNSLGYMVASIFGGRWMDNIMQREARKANRYDEKGRLILRPEDRMRENAWVGAFLYPAGLLWYGWAAEKGVYWLVPMIANFFFGMGSMLIFSMATTMLTEFMPKKSSEGVALNNFMRNICSCVGSLVTAPIIGGIGNGWLFTILGVVGFASSAVIFLMRVNGPKWRKTMDAKMHS